MSRIAMPELEKYLWGAAIILRGSMAAGSYKNYIFPLLFYKRICDVYDEEYQRALEESGGDIEYASFAENHRFQVPEEAHWKVIRDKSSSIGMAIQRALKKIEYANRELLEGVFGDAAWTNKNRLPDTLLKELIEHFSSQVLSLENCPEDDLGNGYEYLIKQFADDSGHTAQEFYTNRTVVHLMTELLQPQPGESIYDPTCGSAGMLISSIAYLKEQQKEWRTVRLYGQELNLLTSAIGRMNLFLHGVENFKIVQGDTLAAPYFLDDTGKIRTFDLVLANPPYSIKQWNREAFASDPYGRNFLGTPPQGRADYAFFQHILKSLDPKTGRCAILFPHGVLFRNEEAEMRKKLVDSDLVECVIGIGKGLFYNSPMEACIVICRTNKPANRRNKVLFINAKDEVTKDRSYSWLEEQHIQKIASVYHAFTEADGFSAIVDNHTILANDGRLSLPLYVRGAMATASSEREEQELPELLNDWLVNRDNLHQELDSLFEMLLEEDTDSNNVTTQVSVATEGTVKSPKKKKSVQPAYLRALLAAEIVYQNHNEKKFGSVKLEKLLYLCDAHFELEEKINQSYLRQAAGPYDPKGMRSIRQNLISHKWFDVKNPDGKSTKYIPLEKCGQHRDAYEHFFAAEKERIQSILDLMKDWNTQQCEIIATLYKSWKDFLLRDATPSYDDIVDDVLHHWHPSKQAIPRTTWEKALQWMKKHGLYPGGHFGKTGGEAGV